MATNVTEPRLRIDGLVDTKRGLQAKSIYYDPGVYARELETVFAKCWLFLAQDNLIPKPGDYLVTFMGEDEVVVVRQLNGEVRAFLNYCTHRGARLAVAEVGNTRAFTCSYHAWAFGLDGQLANVPLEKEAYPPCFDKAAHALREVRVENYHGFYYGTFDQAAPSFRDYLGDMAWYYDIWFEHTGGLELIGPPTRTLLHTNWKFTAENFAGDVYHAPWTHSNYFVANQHVDFGKGEGNSRPPDGFQVTTRYGHGAGVLLDIGHGSIGPEAGALLEQWYRERKPAMIEKLGAERGGIYGAHVNTTIFPNNSFLMGSNQFKVWHIRGPGEIELWSWTVVEKATPQDMKEALQKGIARAYFSAGIVEVEDADNLEGAYSINRGTQVRRGWMNAQLGLGQECEDPVRPGVIAPRPMSEVCHRGFYRAYADFMSGADWPEIEAGSANWKQQLLERQA